MSPYQKQPFLMIILAVRGRGKNLVIDRNSIVKNENLKILTKTHVIYLKRKLRTCTIKIQPEKVIFLPKKIFFLNFLIFHLMLEDPPKFLTFNFLEVSKNKSKNGFSGTCQVLKGTKSWILVSLSLFLWKRQTGLGRPGHNGPPLPKIGLTP